MNLILCGLPKSGKTTIGKIIAKHLSRNFIDTDNLIEHDYHAEKGVQFNCRQIVRHEGEPYFRNLEKKHINCLKEIKNHVIAIGGGSLSDPENIQCLQQIGRFIYLKTDPQILWKRVIVNGIPAYLDPNNPEIDFFAIMKKRQPLLEKVADVIIETGNLSEQEICSKILLYKEYL